jgi:hypothetical protein
MKKMKAKKVYTPRSGKGLSPSRPRTMQGRPVHCRKRYYEDNHQQAVKEVKEHRMSHGEAGQEFQVPKTTLFDRVKDLVSLGGPLSSARWRKSTSSSGWLSWGFPVSRKDMRTKVQWFWIFFTFL